MMRSLKGFQDKIVLVASGGLEAVILVRICREGSGRSFSGKRWIHRTHTAQIIDLTGVNAAKDYPDPLRPMGKFPYQTERRLKFLTKNFSLPALRIALLDKSRWRSELLLKWMRPHLGAKGCYANVQNAIKIQGRIGVSACVLVTILKKGLCSKLRHNSTDLELVALRENASFASTYATGFQKLGCQPRDPVESIRLLTRQQRCLRLNW